MQINKKKRIFIYFLFLISLLISILAQEDSSGGAQLDKILTKNFYNNFNKGFLEGIEYFIVTSQIHSPIFYFLVNKLNNLFTSNFTQVLYFLISGAIPLIFYKVLKIKFEKNVDKNILFSISLIIFLSPYFRSSMVWITTDNLALFFFIISLYFYFVFIEKNENRNINFILSLFFLVLASYIRQHFAIFYIYFIFYGYLKLNKKSLSFMIFLSMLMALPAIYYYFYAYKIFFNFQVVEVNYYNNFLVYLSILLFYLLPFFISQKNLDILKITFLQRKKFLISSFLLVLFSYFLSDYNYYEYGGGVFIKLINYLELNFLLLLLSIISVIIVAIFINNIESLIILFLLFISYPFGILYQKYFDPVFFILFMTLIKSDFLYKSLKTNKINLKIIFSYFLIFLITANIYY